MWTPEGSYRSALPRPRTKSYVPFPTRESKLIRMASPTPGSVPTSIAATSSDSTAIPHIVIIGGGFTGSIAAVQLVRQATIPLRITLINHGSPVARGIAYSSYRAEHLLNVPARNMSALAEDPDHFVNWLTKQSDYAQINIQQLRDEFMPRQLYGGYLQSILMEYVRTPSDDASCSIIRSCSIDLVEGEAVDIQLVGSSRPAEADATVQSDIATATVDPTEKGLVAQVFLSNGRCLDSADKVLLATGNETPADLPGTASSTVSHHPGWCANPWSDWPSKLPPNGATIALLGTGLTAVDAIITLLAKNWTGTIRAISRHGLLPHSHFKKDELQSIASVAADFPPANVNLCALTLNDLANMVEQHCERLRGLGFSPAILVDKMRPITQKIWQSWPLKDKREFMSRYAARWNILRHRIAPTLHTQIEAAISSGLLKVSAGSIQMVSACGDKLSIETCDQQGASHKVEASLVVNCTGPQTAFSKTRSYLLRNILRRGLIDPDGLDMGVCVSSDFCATDRKCERSPIFYVIGPLIRGTLWETIAVPELRQQARQVAQSLLDDVMMQYYPSHEQETI
ncbi:unnamed protein product [Calypogeia fissa]